MADRRREAATGRPIDGRLLLSAARAATAWLALHRDAIDALNVYPVPDGDTGTNMLMTMRAAVERGEAALRPGVGAGEMAATLATGALLGARGNSGVILSQIVRGFAEGIAVRATLDGRDIARALELSRDHAYRAVLRPVEGTMLTVVRAAAEQARASAERTPEAMPVLLAALAGARDALARTPDLLDILRRAGVVDAGGQGVVHLLEGVERYARGERAPRGVAVASSAAIAGEMAFLDRIADLHGEDAFGYCTNFLVVGEAIDVEAARRGLAAMGTSAVIVGDRRLLKVHLHTLDPGAALAYAATLGQLDQIKIDNMQTQTGALIESRSGVLGGGFRGSGERLEATTSPPPAPRGTSRVTDRDQSLEPDNQRPTPLAVIAVAAGEGLAAALRSMGADEIVPGGQTMNPSVAELVRAIEQTAAEAVILLPNNPNILLAAWQAPALASKPTTVVPTRSVPQGLAALAAFDPDATMPHNAARMTAALETVRTVEVTRAVRDADIDGIAVWEGEAIGLVDDRLAASGADEAAVLREALGAAGADQAELITLFWGEAVDPSEADEVGRLVAAWHPAAAVELLAGGQPHYRYVAAVE